MNTYTDCGTGCTCLMQDPRPPPSSGSQLSHSALELQSSRVATVMVGREREGVGDSSEEERRAVQEATLWVHQREMGGWVSQDITVITTNATPLKVQPCTKHVTSLPPSLLPSIPPFLLLSFSSFFLSSLHPSLPSYVNLSHPPKLISISSKKLL